MRSDAQSTWLVHTYESRSTCLPFHTIHLARPGCQKRGVLGDGTVESGTARSPLAAATRACRLGSAEHGTRRPHSHLLTPLRRMLLNALKPVLSTALYFLFNMKFPRYGG